MPSDISHEHDLDFLDFEEDEMTDGAEDDPATEAFVNSEVMDGNIKSGIPYSNSDGMKD